MRFLFRGMLLIVVLFCNEVLNAQTNQLGAQDFSAIKFDGVSISDIWGTRADCANVNALFKYEFSCVQNNTAPYLARDIYNDRLSFGFEDESDSGDEYALARIEVKKRSVQVEVDGVIVKLGGSASVFPNSVKVNVAKNGERSIVYDDEATMTVSVSFDLDDSDIIYKIYFIAF